MNLAAHLFARAETRPDHPAVIQGGESVDYRDFAGRVARTAGHLSGLGIGQGTVVALALGDDIDHLVALSALSISIWCHRSVHQLIGPVDATRRARRDDHCS